MIQERRKEPRYALSGLVEIFDKRRGDSRAGLLGTGLIEDVSASGACIQMEQAVDIGTELVIMGCGRTPDITITVRNIRQADVGFLVGVEFTGGFQVGPPAIPSIPAAAQGWASEKTSAIRPSPGANSYLKESPSVPAVPEPNAPHERAARGYVSFARVLQRIRALYKAKDTDGVAPAGEHHCQDALATRLVDPLGLFEDLPANAVVLDSELEITHANTAFVRLVGSAALLSDRGFAKLVAPGDLSRVIDCAKAAVSEPGVVMFVDFALRGAGGDIVEVSSSWRYSSRGSRTVVQIADVSHERRVERELIAVLNRTEGDGELIGMAAYSWNVRSGRLQCSRDYGRLFGLGPETVALERAAWMGIIHPEDRPRIEAALLPECLSESDMVRLQFRARRADGAEICIASRGYVVFDKDGRPMKIVGKMIDSTRGNRQARDEGR